MPTSNNSTNYPDNPSKWTSFSRTFNNLSAGSHRIIFGAKASSLENGTNERVYLYVDNLTVTTVSSGSGAPPADPTGTLWSAHFNSGVELFAFAKDTFITPGSRYTDGSGNDELQGSRVTDTGAWGDGALQVRLGLVDGQTTPANNMSGGWSRDFTVGTADNCVTVQGYYRIHVPFNAYEGDEEFGEVLLSVDGGLPQVIFNTQSLSDPDNNNQDYDSGWVPFSVTIPNLTATTHTLTLGGFNNRATWSDERMEIWFDDVYVVENTSGAATSSQGESNDLLTLTNRGSSALTGDDNGTGAGYHLMHQTVGTGPFEMYVRVDAAPNNGSLGLAGLEIRGDETERNFRQNHVAPPQRWPAEGLQPGKWLRPDH